MKIDLDLQQLRMFWMLAQTRSFTETARRLYRTQSAVSHAIRKLEQSIGAQLVVRKGRRVRLTEEGRHLFDACEVAFGSLEAASEIIAEKQGRSIGSIRLGATVEFGCSILMKHMQPFVEAHPEIEMHFFMKRELISMLLRDDLDMIIDCKVHNYPQLQRTVLFREQYVVACSPDYRQSREIRQPGDLSNCAVLTLDDEVEWWHHFVFSIPKINRPTFTKVITINHIRGMIMAAKSGMGVALVPRYSIMHEIESGELFVLFPELELLEDRFIIYQKLKRSKLHRHKVLTKYLQGITPAEFGS